MKGNRKFIRLWSVTQPHLGLEYDGYWGLIELYDVLACTYSRDEIEADNVTLTLAVF